MACPPSDAQAYQKRGIFLASTYREAEFWGRPLDSPIRVSIQYPIIGDEALIEMELLSERSEFPGHTSTKLLEWRWKLDAKPKKAAENKGYDAIVLLSPSGYAKFIAEGKIPLSIKLNLIAGPEAAVAQSIAGRGR